MPVYRLTEECVFPPPHLASPEGLLAVGGDLSRERLLLAYSMGIFPWYGEAQPILWWSPNPRLVITPESLHVSKRLRRELRRTPFVVTFDTAFEDVIRNCAEKRGPNRESTWIIPDMMEAYVDLHRYGVGHSVECWRDGRLVGGLYGLSLGRCFFGESMFSHERDASKVALVYLVRQTARWQFPFVDCQVPNDHLLRMGAMELPRGSFLTQLRAAMRFETRRGPWQFDSDITAAP